MRNYLLGMDEERTLRHGDFKATIESVNPDYRGLGMSVYRCESSQGFRLVLSLVIDFWFGQIRVEVPRGRE